MKRKQYFSVGFYSPRIATALQEVLNANFPRYQFSSEAVTIDKRHVWGIKRDALRDETVYRCRILQFVNGFMEGVSWSERKAVAR